jgi:hypothetical protein
MAGQPISEISGAQSGRCSDETSGDLFSAIPVYFAVLVVMAERPGKGTPDGKPRMPGVTHGS